MDNNTQKSGSNVGGIVGLVCGIISIVLYWVPWFNIITLILGIVGIVFSVKGRKNAPGGKTGLATAGLVLSIIGTVLSGIGFITCTLCVTCAATATAPYYY